MHLEIAIGKVLKKHRVEKGFSQEKLALQCGLDRTYIGLLERGHRNPTIKTIFSISKSLSIPPHKLIKEIESYQDKQ